MKVKLIRFKDDAITPFRAHYDDAGADVYISDRDIIRVGETRAIGLGFGLEIPNGFCGMIVPRSSWAKRGIICQLPPIDAGYRGEIHAIVSNISTVDVKLNKHERVGQLIIIPIIIADFYEDTQVERKDGAFGSTGM